MVYSLKEYFSGQNFEWTITVQRSFYLHMNLLYLKMDDSGASSDGLGQHTEALYRPFHNDDNLCLINLLSLSLSLSFSLFNKSYNVSLAKLLIENRCLCTFSG